MGTFAPIPKLARNTTSDRPKSVAQELAGHGNKSHAVLALQSTIGNRVLRRLLGVNSGRSKAQLQPRALTPDRQDLSRKPVRSNGYALGRLDSTVSALGSTHSQERGRTTEHVTSTRNSVYRTSSYGITKLQPDCAAFGDGETTRHQQGADIEGGAIRLSAVAPLVQKYPTNSIQRSTRANPGQAGSGKQPELVPYVPGILRAHYPHLLKVIGSSELTALQASVDAYARYRKANERRIAFEQERIHTTSSGWGGASSDVRQWRRLQSIESRHKAAAARGNLFEIDARLMLANDVRNSGLDNEPINAYHKALYKRVTELPMKISANPKLAFNQSASHQYLVYEWGPYNWQVSHDEGLVHFRHLMAAQKLNLEYTKVVLGEQIKVLDKLIVLRREMGESYNMEGKKLGEFDSGFWDPGGTDVFLDYEAQSEQGLLGGYVNDPKGRFQMTQDLYAKHLSNRSRVVLLSPGNYLHIFPTRPQFWSQELTDENDGYRYLNTNRGDSVLNVQQIITTDARALNKARSRKYAGWRTENELSGFEQFAIGVIFGDAFEQSSGWATFGQIITGLVPVVGQIADARDVAIGIHKIWTTGGKEGKLQTAFALLGFAPFVGDAVKSAYKSGGKQAAEAVNSVAKSVGEGMSESAGRQIKEAAERGGRDEAADVVGRKAEDLRAREGAGRGGAGSIRDAVRKSADEAAATGESAFEASRQTAEDAAAALGHKLPDLDAPILVDQIPVKMAGESHTVKVVRQGKWKQFWLCSTCAELIGMVDDAIKAGGKAQDDLVRLRQELKDMEWKLNKGTISDKRLRGKLRAASAKLERVARRNPDLAGLQPFLAKRFDAAWQRRYPGPMPSAAVTAKAKGFPPPPPGYHWVDNQGRIYLRRNKTFTGPELRYDPTQKSFFRPEGTGRRSPQFADDVDGAMALDLLGGNDPKSPFGMFVKMLDDELGVKKNQLIADLNARKLAGATHDTVRGALKGPYRQRLLTKLTDTKRLAGTPTYKSVLAKTGDPHTAMRSASYEEFLEISRKLGPADKGSLGEAWYHHWFAHRGTEISKQTTLGAAQGLKDVRRIDIYEDHLVREIKNVTTAMGAKEADQLAAQIKAIGQAVDVKVGNQVIKSGYDSVRYAFLDPAGAALNARWMVDQLAKHPKASLSFQILNKRGRPMVFSSAHLAKYGADGLVKRIVKWTR